ncbi:BadF/BadG/BcrA/BcrD ATPase family protein [Nocardiopsis coralliicola]
MLGRGLSGGANQFSSADPGAALAEALRTAAGAARAAAGEISVRAAVLGAAGASAAGHERAVVLAERAWAEAGLDGPGTGVKPQVTDDIAIAFAAGTARPDGAVLIAGTGAVAARIAGGAVAARCDGYGWLLGDAGSAVWIALEGLRAALAALDGRGAPTVLTGRLAAALDAAPGDPQAIVRAVYARPPAELGALAPDVTAAAAAGPGPAAQVCAAAADRLVETFSVVAPAAGGPGGPAAPAAVLAGSVLSAGPVAEQVRARVAERIGAAPLAAGDGALGAAGLALRAAGAPESAHSGLIAG